MTNSGDTDVLLCATINYACNTSDIQVFIDSSVTEPKCGSQSMLRPLQALHSFDRIEQDAFTCYQRQHRGFPRKVKLIQWRAHAVVTSRTRGCVCAFCAAAMAGKLIRNLSEKLPVEGACPCLWWRAAFCAAEMAGELIRNLSEKLLLKGLAPVFGVEPEKHSAREKHSESKAHKKRRNPKVPPQKAR